MADFLVESKAEQTNKFYHAIVIRVKMKPERCRTCLSLLFQTLSILETVRS